MHAGRRPPGVREASAPEARERFPATRTQNATRDLPYDASMTRRFAALADIHGNVWALEAVLDHARRRGVTRFVNLGDVLYGPLQPQETFLRLQSETVLAAVAGNEDRVIVDASARERDRNRTLRLVVEALGTEAVDWLRQLPVTAVRDGDVLLCHGSPGDDTVYLGRCEGGAMYEPGQRLVIRKDDGTEQMVLVEDVLADNGGQKLRVKDVETGVSSVVSPMETTIVEHLED